MDRRDVLKLGMVGALGGCAARQTTFRAVEAPPWTPAQVDEALAQMDATLAKLAAAAPRPADFGVPATLQRAQVARGHDLVVRTLAAMHVAATFRELPSEVQARDDVQRRMWGAIPLIDDAMLDATDYLSSLSPSERRALQDRLREEPSLGMEMIGKLDEHGAAAGVPARRRAQLRAIAAQVTWRMSRQSAGAVLDETLDKVGRVRERHGHDEELQRAIAARVTEAELFDRSQPHLVFATSVPTPERHHASSRVLATGLVLMGIGAAHAGIGGIILAADKGTSGWFWVGAVSVTIGALLGVVAIVFLLVGAILAVVETNSSDKPDEGS